MVDSEILLNRITRIIAATRFPFVDQENWSDDRRTVINDETKRFGIKWEKGIIYPGLVVFNGDGSVREYGLVEPAEAISEESIQKWGIMSDVAPYGRKYKKLFFYVPEGYEEAILRILEDNDIEFDGIRGYRIERGSLKIIPYKTLNDEYDHQIT
jgi:hypothetical protein